MKKLLATAATALVLLTAAQTVQAQNRTQPNVIVTTELDENNNLLFNADVTGEGVFTIELNINGAENCKAPSKVVTSVRSSGIFYKIAPEKEDGCCVPYVEFTYNWVQGEVDPMKLNREFVYRLPFAAGMSSEVTMMSAQQMGMARDNVVNFRFFRFDLSEGADVYAVRSGLVVTTTNDSSDRNRIVIQHQDGSMATYVNVSRVNVREGDRVTPATVIGKAGMLDNNRYGIYLSVTYFQTNQSRIHQGFAQMVFIDPVFMTTNGKRTVEGGDVVTAKVNRKLLRKEK